MKEESEILQLLGKGDEKPIKIIFDKYYEGLCLYAESLIKNKQKVEEIVEDIFIYLWLNSKSIKIYSSLKNYLFRSVHNNCLKYLKKQKAELLIHGDWDYLIKDKEILQPDSYNYPVSNLIVNELEEKANKILDKLPKQCKKIYSLNRYENLSYSEIAKKLNITVGTVKTQMSRAFSKFREGLTEYIPLLLILFI
jgi:RNA polymerase sigma-70 factor (family 1)